MEIAILVVSLNHYGDLSLILILWNWHLTRLWIKDLSLHLDWHFVTQQTSAVPANSWEPRQQSEAALPPRLSKAWSSEITGCQASLSLSAVLHVLPNWVRLVDSGEDRHPQNNKNSNFARVCKWCGTPISGATCGCIDLQDPFLPGRWREFPSITIHPVSVKNKDVSKALCPLSQQNIEKGNNEKKSYRWNWTELAEV